MSVDAPWGVASDAGRSFGEIVVRPIRSAAELDEVYRLTHDAHVDRGQCEPQLDGRLIHYPYLDNTPETIVLVAVASGRIIGTSSVTLDGARGLHVDEDFKTECDAIRAEGRPLCASWRIATRPDFRGKRGPVMALIEETVRAMIASGSLTCVFTFHERHERIYRKLLNLQTVARRESIRHFSNSASVFMRWDLERCPERWLRTPEERALQARARSSQWQKEKLA